MGIAEAVEAEDKHLSVAYHCCSFDVGTASLDKCYLPRRDLGSSTFGGIRLLYNQGRSD